MSATPANTAWSSLCALFLTPTPAPSLPVNTELLRTQLLHARKETDYYLRRGQLNEALKAIDQLSNGFWSAVDAVLASPEAGAPALAPQYTQIRDNATYLRGGIEDALALRLINLPAVEQLIYLRLYHPYPSVVHLERQSETIFRDFEVLKKMVPRLAANQTNLDLLVRCLARIENIQLQVSTSQIYLKDIDHEEADPPLALLKLIQVNTAMLDTLIQRKLGRLSRTHSPIVIRKRFEAYVASYLQAVRKFYADPVPENELPDNPVTEPDPRFQAHLDDLSNVVADYARQLSPSKIFEETNAYKKAFDLARSDHVRRLYGRLIGTLAQQIISYGDAAERMGLWVTRWLPSDPDPYYAKMRALQQKTEALLAHVGRYAR